MTRLSDHHLHELHHASAIDPAIVTERDYRTLDRHDRQELARLGVTIGSDASFPGLLIPIYRATGELISVQFKPATPIGINGKLVKYLSPRGQVNRLDVHPRNRARITDAAVPLWITEGVKKGDSLTSRGCCVVTLTGVFNWRSKHGTLGDWEDVPLKGREITICFDADAAKNMNVARAMVRLGRWCYSKGARKVLYLIVPGEVNGKITKGADDYFAAGGTLDGLIAAATTTEPETESADDTFTDARLAETIAAEVLADHFVWCKGLEWLEWTGQRWQVVTEEAVGEKVRQHALRRFAQAVESTKKTGIDGWQSMLSARRQRAVLMLAKGIMEHTADAFDADPDLLNTPGGVVDLRTGQVHPHDPDLLITKSTSGSYRPGYTHPDWTQALTALPTETADWFQARVGQAITGHPTPDGLIPILQNGGEGGKSALTTDGIVPAFGEYAAPASPKLISSKDEHSTERADLRGQRFLIAEELTEDRALNVTAIKQITDVSTIKARYVHKDNITFRASHSLFVTTNYIPVVNETDHGTWRRLARVPFPFTFRKPAEPLTGPNDRRGDPRLKARIRAGAGGQHDAIVTWAVDGARRWYKSGLLPALPATVEIATRQWRRCADRVLGFWDDCLAADPDACVLTTEMLAAFNAWLQSNGHHEWSKELFHPRFKAHTETARHRVEERRTTKLEGLSRAPGLPWQDAPVRAFVYDGVRFRTDSEIDENIQDDDGVAEMADPSGNFSGFVPREEFAERSATSATACCEGGPTQMKCKLCPASETYWQRATEVVV